MNFLIESQLNLISGSMEAAKFFVGCADITAVILLSLFIQKKANDWYAVIMVVLIILLAIEIWKK